MTPERCPLCDGEGDFCIQVNGIYTGSCYGCGLPIRNWPEVQRLKDRVAELEGNAISSLANIESCHALLTKLGVPVCEAGTVCNDPDCHSKLYHRISAFAREQLAKEPVGDDGVL